MIQYNLVLPTFEATPKNVRIWDAIDPIVTKKAISREVYLISEPAAGAGVFPAEGHVRSPDQYGPTGVEFMGAEQLPGIAEVKLGVGYGEDGTEFTGTYSPAGGGLKVPGVGNAMIKRGN